MTEVSIEMAIANLKQLALDIGVSPLAIIKYIEHGVWKEEQNRNLSLSFS